MVSKQKNQDDEAQPGDHNTLVEDSGEDPNTELDYYEDLFVSVQEYCVGQASEVYTEGQHSMTKMAGKRTAKIAGPTYVCARQRRGKIAQMLDEPTTLEYVVTPWNPRGCPLHPTAAAARATE